MKTLIMVDVWQWTPFVFIIVYARLQAFPQDVFEAAQLDGATRLSTLRRVTLPLLMPVAYLACPVVTGITGIALPIDAGIGATWDNFRDPPWVNR